MSNEKKLDARAMITEQCISCGICCEDCILLQEIGEDPSAIAARGATVEEAFACFMCGQCQAVCPLDLSPGEMFGDRRKEAVAAGEIDIEEYRYLFSDRPLNVMSVFRRLNDIDYQDLNQTIPARVGFFPGCTMSTFAPALTRKLYESLKEIYPELVFVSECCGKALDQMGVTQRVDNNRLHVRNKVKKMGIELLITACANCYYELPKYLQDQNVKVATVYEVLKDRFNMQKLPEGSSVRCTVHDSCPDRFQGTIGQQVRNMLREASYNVVEMEHNRATTFCCGSGGHVGHFRPDFVEETIERRVKEAQDVDTDLLVTYCLSCALNFSKNNSGVKVKHVLNLLLGVDEDYEGLKNKSQTMFDGEDGEKIWQQIMDGPERIVDNG